MPSRRDEPDIDDIIERVIQKMAREWVRILRRERNKMKEIFDADDDD